MNSVRGYFCWLFGHSYICLFRHYFGSGSGSEDTAWECQYCGKTKTEQWDS
jgi:hypothetical protein